MEHPVPVQDNVPIVARRRAAAALAAPAPTPTWLLSALYEYFKIYLQVIIFFSSIFSPFGYEEDAIFKK